MTKHTVRVQVKNQDGVKRIERSVAERLVAADPVTYRILDEPKIDVVKLPPVVKSEPEAEKKSVEPVAADKPVYVEPEVQEMKKVQTVPQEPKRPGRPKANA